MERILNFIGGQFCEAETGESIPCYEPATGAEYARVAASGAKDIASAVENARLAFPKWRGTSIQERSDLLRKISVSITKRIDEFASAESQDSGKPVRVARDLDIPRSSKNFGFFADAVTQFHGQAFSDSDSDSNTNTLNYTTYDPLGVVACISPWNLPLYLLTWKIAPAMAAGNCVIAKPSEVTPKSASLLCEIFDECGLPPGVVNMVHGFGSAIGKDLCSHPDVKAVSFTGSTATGKLISEYTAGSFKKISLEMGGKNPFVIFDDVNLELVTDWAIKASFSNQGQICLCGSRILVQESIYPQFKDLILRKIKQLSVGDPKDAKTDQGALVSQVHLDKIIQAVERAQGEGGKVLIGGERVYLKGRCERGFFFAPTVIEGLGNEALTNQEEIFGPVVTLIPFKDEAQAVHLANGTGYGLAASIWTSNITRAHRVARDLESGIVWVNTWMSRDLRTPFGGVKNSGVGREGGFEALRFFSEVKNICIGANT